MAEADSKLIARPEELHRFLKAVLAASDSHTLTMMLAYHGGWIELCRRVLAALADDPPTNPELAAACRKAGILPQRLRQCLEPVAEVLGPRSENNRQQDYFEILGVSAKATEEEIRRAYRRRARRLHPDHGGAPHAFIELSTAYQTLIDPEQRRLYEAGVQPSEVEWHVPPTPPEQAPRKRSRFPVFMVLLLSLLVALTFALEFVQQLRTPRHPRRSDQAAAPPVRMQAGTLAAPEVLGGKDQATLIADPGTPGPLMPPTDRRNPADAQDLTPTDPAPGSAPPPPAPTNRREPLARTANGAPGFSPHAENLRPPPVKRPATVSFPIRLALIVTPEVDTAATNQLVDFLRRQGYRLSTPARKIFTGPSSVRFFHAKDRPAAKKLHRAIQSYQPRLSEDNAPPLRLVDLSRRYPDTPHGLLEIWIGAAKMPVAASRAIESPGAATARASAPPQIEMRLRAFLDDFCRAYESTDLVQLFALFHDRAQENGQPIEAVLPIYMANMARTAALDYRIELDDFQRSDPQGPVQIEGRFYAHVQLQDHQVRESHGPIAMELLPYGKSFLIKSLNYKQDN